MVTIVKWLDDSSLNWTLHTHCTQKITWMLQNVTTTWFVTRSKACRKGKAASWNSAVLSIVVAFSHKAANVFVGQRRGVATNCQQTLCGSEGFLHNPRLCGISACLNPTGINAADPMYFYLFGGNFQPSTTFRAVYNPKLWVGGGKRPAIDQAMVYAWLTPRDSNRSLCCGSMLAACQGFHACYGYSML